MLRRNHPRRWPTVLVAALGVIGPGGAVTFANPEGPTRGQQRIDPAQEARGRAHLALARSLLYEDLAAAATEAAAALPLQQAADQAWARLIIGRAHLRAGRVEAARQELVAARKAFLAAAAAGSRADSTERLWLERTLPRLGVALANPRLVLTREVPVPSRVGDVRTPVRRGAATFRALAGGRVVRRLNEGPERAWAMSPFVVTHILALDEERVVVWGDGHLALLAPGVVWQDPPHGRAKPLHGTPELLGDVLLARGSPESAVLDPRTGRTLWRGPGPSLDCPSCERQGFLVRSALTDKDPRSGRPLAEMRWYTAWAPVRTGRTAWQVGGRSVAAAAGKETVLLADEQGGLRAFDRASGQERWSRPVRSRVSLETFPSVATSLDGETYYVYRGADLQAFEAATGTSRWRRAWWPAAAPTRRGAPASPSRLVEARDGVLLAQLWWAQSLGPALDLALYTSAGDLALHESVPSPGGRLENWSTDTDTLRFPGPENGELETWDLAGVPRHARAAARTEPWPLAFAFARQDDPDSVSTEGPRHSLRVSHGLLAIQPRGAAAPLELSLETPAGIWRACRLEQDQHPPGSSRVVAAARVVCDTGPGGARLSVDDAGDRIELNLELPPGAKPEATLTLSGVGPLAMADDVALAEGAPGRLRLFPPSAYQWLKLGDTRIPTRVPVRATLGPSGGLRLELEDPDPDAPVHVRLEGLLAAPSAGEGESRSVPAAGPAGSAFTDESILALLEASRDGDARGREEARGTLDRMGAAALPGLLAALQAPRLDVRNAAATRLGFLARESGQDPSRVVGPLVDLLQGSRSVETRGAAAAALSSCGPAASASLPLLLQLVEERDSSEVQRSLRQTAAYAVGRIGAPKEAGPVLARGLGDQNLGAADALWKIDPGLAESLLVRAVREQDAWTCNTLVATMGTVTDHGVPNALVSALGLASCRLKAVRALAESRDPAIRKPLSRALEDPDPNVRKEAVSGLYDLMTLKDPAKALEGRRALPGLIRALGDSDSGVRAAAVKTLTGIGTVPPQAVVPLERLLDDPIAAVRRDAATAIGAAGLAGRRSGPALLRASRDADRHVQDAAEEALRQVKWGVSEKQLAREAELAGAAILQMAEDEPGLLQCPCVGVRQLGDAIGDPPGDVMRRLRRRCPKARTYGECARRSPAKLPCASHLLVGPITWRSEDEAEIEVSVGGPFERDFGTLVVSRVGGKWVVSERRLEHFSSE